MKDHTFFNPVRYFFGKGVARQLGIHAAVLGKKALLVTTPGTLARHGSSLCASLTEANMAYEIFTGVQPNPLASTVRKGADFAAETGCDLIIGFGGGSAMDTAKGIAFLTGKEGGIFDYITGKCTGTTALPIICITTTAGTGS